MALPSHAFYSICKDIIETCTKCLSTFPTNAANLAAHTSIVMHSHPSHRFFSPFICRDHLVDFSSHMTPLEEADANIASLLEELRCVQQKPSDACTRRNALRPACKLHPELLTLIFELLKDPATNDECRAEEEDAHF
jgi:hypothetical protein